MDDKVDFHFVQTVESWRVGSLLTEKKLLILVSKLRARNTLEILTPKWRDSVKKKFTQNSPVRLNPAVIAENQKNDTNDQ